MPTHRKTPAVGKRLALAPRYLRLYTDPGVELAERNYRYATVSWRLPLSQAAMVSLDVWNWHFAADTLERIEDITRNRIAPLFAACRRGGLQIVHAPAWPVAERHPNWVKLLPPEAKPQPAWPDSPVWPPPAFRQKSGVYKAYARPGEPQAEYRSRHCRELRQFHPVAGPGGDEAVVLNGEELHRLCAQRGILFLFHVGFNTNACLVMRDYGTLAMMQRGYETIVVRDCTTGMETHETVADLTCTRGQIASLEQFGAYSVTSDELTAALRRARSRTEEPAP